MALAVAEFRHPAHAMSHDLYATRLYWSGRRGVAKLHGRCVDLHAPPHIAGQPVVAVDYIPEIGLRQIQPVAERPRDMDDAEVRQADAVLRAIVTPAAP